MIAHYFVKSTIVKRALERGPTNDDDIADQEALQAQIAEVPGVQDPLPIEEFINPAVEEIMDKDEDIIEAIIETYSRDQEEDAEEEGGEESEEPPV